MIQVYFGNITAVDSDLLVNASNGKGWMGGIVGRFIELRGVAESIHYIDYTIEKEAKKYCKLNKPKNGETFITGSGKLPFTKGILHAITMKNKGMRSNEGIVRECAINIAKFCKENHINSVSIPLLGTGTGRVNIQSVLDIYLEYFRDHSTLFKIVLLEDSSKIVSNWINENKLSFEKE
jgi:O-acetyl-ADP-ribose deacetylase (regulator of RNase III)